MVENAWWQEIFRAVAWEFTHTFVDQEAERADRKRNWTENHQNSPPEINKATS